MVENRTLLPLNGFMEDWKQPCKGRHIEGSFRRLENYIPIRSNDLCQKLLKEFEPLGSEQWDEAHFMEFQRRLGLVNKMRLTEEFDDWQEAYAYFDPDVDVVLPVGTATRRDAVAGLRDRFRDTMKHVLGKAGFEEVSEEDMRVASEQRSIMGLPVEPPDPKKVQCELFFRGQRVKEFQAKSFKSCYLCNVGIPLKTYQRVLMLFNVPDGDGDQLAPLCFCCKQPKNAIKAEESVVPGLWYLKMFKDVAVSDIDMLLPGSSVKFSVLDHLLIWIPVLIGLISAVVKAVQGTFDFSSTTNILTTLALVGMPLSWGAKAYSKIKQKEDTYNAHLTQLLSMHNLANNSGVISTMLDEAADQENNEALLAFFFLWRGQTDPRPVSQRLLDKEIEKFLNRFMVEHKLKARINFDVEDACQKLEEIGLVSRGRDDDGEYALKALGLEQAIEMVSTYKFSQSKESNGSDWQECFDAYPPTGQQMRYFWNKETNESKYSVPNDFTPAKK